MEIDKTRYTEDNIEIIPLGKATNIIGQTFGRLTVIGRAPKDNPKRTGAYWWCKCSCGNIIKVRGDCLRGNTSSCGCYQRELASERMKKIAAIYNPIIGRNNKKDLTGQRFGYLTVLEDTNKRAKTGNGTQVIWRCQCDCGNITEVTSSHLSSGHTTSCGCRKMSKGAEKILQILTKNNISFIQEYRDKNCKLSTGGIARFDFYANNLYYIEYDGEQHFDCEYHGWNDEQNFKKIQIRDKEKNEYCLKNNIPLIRIPYTRYNELSIEDLIPETSRFLVTKESENIE